MGKIAPVRLGNEALYRQIQEDAITLIESIGLSVTAEIAAKIMGALAPGEEGGIDYLPDIAKLYVPAKTIEKCMERIRQGFDYWPRGFGTGGMAAYVADSAGARLPDLTDLKRLAEVFAKTDELTSLQSSFNPCSRIRKCDSALRGELESASVDVMVECAGGKLTTPTVRTEKGFQRIADYHDRGYKMGAALSIVSTNMTVSEECLDQLLLTTGLGIPFLMNSMPIGGLTGPYSLSALAALGQAQALFGMVLGQLIRPGRKCINAAMPTVADLSKKDMPLLFGCLPNTLVNILLAELNGYLGLASIQSACCHSASAFDENAKREAAETYRLVNACSYHAMRHLFGFASQLNDYSIDDMEKQIDLYREVCREPSPAFTPDPVKYDAEGLEAVIEGMARGDFRNLDHTLKHVGAPFA